MSRPMSFVINSFGLLALGTVLACAAEDEVSNLQDKRPQDSGTDRADPGNETGPGPGADTTLKPIALPFAVDEVFAPAFMGDGVTAGKLTDKDDCPSRQGTELGVCHHVTYIPAAIKWAGAFWLAGDQNWGNVPGFNIEAGATQVSFWAWSTQDGDVVSFFAGLADSKVTYPDAFRVEKAIPLTTTPTQYNLDLSQASYETVVGAFGWSAAAHENGTQSEFFIDDIKWTK